jgi:D-alanyl-D-alanine carboxypeptidase/D-alanyl-D-alanine-endopeptidase (penicillin-binding protein 4)
LNADTGEVLFDRSGDTPASTASGMKTLTAAAALMSLGPNYRATTRVLAEPSAKTSISLVGGGDVTLSKTDAGAQSVFRDAPKLSSLATQVIDWAASNEVSQLSEIILDSTLFAGPAWESSWRRKDQVDGWISEVTALQVDGDRIDPAAWTSPKTGRPVASAGEEFRTLLGPLAETAVLVEAATPAGFVQIASVESQPMSRWIAHTLQTSENLESEMIGRLVSVNLGFDGSFTSIDPAYKQALSSLGLDLGAMLIRDGSGLSNLNMVAPRTLAELMRLVNVSYGEFGLIKSSLPIAGKTGTLSGRFKGDIADAAGSIIAKTGYITEAYTLSGIISAVDGTTLTFAIYALDNVGPDVRVAIDTLATGFYRCGNNLSNE